MDSLCEFGIMGYGYVGKATHFSLLKNEDCIIHDLIFDSTLECLREVDFVFACIPTATARDIDELIKELISLKELNSDVKIILRSTVPIRTCERIQQEIGDYIIYIPEFLRERFWAKDSLKRPIIVGHDDTYLPDWLKKEDMVECSCAEAELIKMFSNNFATMRIAFANLFYDLSEKVGADYDKVKESYFKIAHYDQTYMEVPGHDGTRGFGGKCLPKDLNFIIDTLEKENINQDWFKHVRELNKSWSKKF